jgi:hypothetical protein
LIAALAIERAGVVMVVAPPTPPGRDEGLLGCGARSQP